MLPDSVDSPDNPMEQDAPDQASSDPAVAEWFLGEGDRANAATDLRAFTTGNLVEPLIDGRSILRPAGRGARRGRAGRPGVLPGLPR